MVEGYGDVDAVPALFSRVAHAEGAQVYPLKPPIRGGGISSLRRPGELERHLSLASSRPDADFVLVVVDCDSECPVDLLNEFEPRTHDAVAKFGKEIRFCFIKCEFESWFLADHTSVRLISDGYWKYTDNFPDYSCIVGAKERLSRSMDSRNYKETRDQAMYAKRIDTSSLQQIDRSFRKFVKSVVS